MYSRQTHILTAANIGIGTKPDLLSLGYLYSMWVHPIMQAVPGLVSPHRQRGASMASQWNRLRKIQRDGPVTAGRTQFPVVAKNDPRVDDGANTGIYTPDTSPPQSSASIQTIPDTPAFSSPPRCDVGVILRRSFTRWRGLTKFEGPPHSLITFTTNPSPVDQNITSAREVRNLVNPSYKFPDSPMSTAHFQPTVSTSHLTSHGNYHPPVPQPLPVQASYDSPPTPGSRTAFQTLALLRHQPRDPPGRQVVSRLSR